MDTLSEPWGVALDLAWEAMVSTPTPVGCYSHLAHAELIVPAQLPPTRRHDALTVLTALEPCILCVGAAIMATEEVFRFKAEKSARPEVMALLVRPHSPRTPGRLAPAVDRSGRRPTGPGVPSGPAAVR